MDEHFVNPTRTFINEREDLRRPKRTPGRLHNDYRSLGDRRHQDNFDVHTSDKRVLEGYRSDERRYAGIHRGKGPRNYQRSDERILEEVGERLSNDPHIDARDIEVAVNNGEVFLDGLVSGRDVKHRIDDLLEEVQGARNIVNRLRARDQRRR